MCIPTSSPSKMATLLNDCCARKAFENAIIWVATGGRLFQEITSTAVKEKKLMAPMAKFGDEQAGKKANQAAQQLELAVLPSSLPSPEDSFSSWEVWKPPQHYETLPQQQKTLAPLGSNKREPRSRGRLNKKNYRWETSSSENRPKGIKIMGLHKVNISFDGALDFKAYCLYSRLLTYNLNNAARPTKVAEQVKIIMKLNNFENSIPVTNLLFLRQFK